MLWMFIIAIPGVTPGRIQDVCLCASDHVICDCVDRVLEQDRNHVFPMDDTAKFVLHQAMFL